MTLESQEALFEFGHRGDVVWREDLSLNDGEVDLDLIQPAGVNRCEDNDDVRPFRLQPINGFLAAMGRPGFFVRGITKSRGPKGAPSQMRS
jgi:hypothetical protein